MPREKIRNTEADGYDVQVGWNAVGNDVQLGLETADGRSLLYKLYGNDRNLARIGQHAVDRGWTFGPAKPEDLGELTKAFAGIGREILDLLDGGPTSPGSHEYLSVWAHLDRYGVNRLIKSLRKARDSVFGRDE